MNKTYYDILGVEETASKDDIKKAYRKIAIAKHPDKLKDLSEDDSKKAEKDFMEATEAYHVLIDDDKRSQYDMQLKGATDSIFGDAWSMFGQQQKPVPRGSDVYYTMKYTLEDFINGNGFRTIEIDHLSPCRVCHGSGGLEVKTCSHCNGTGVHVETTRTPFGFARMQSACPYCNGTGKEIVEECPRCHGSKFEQSKKSVEVPVTSSMPDGYVFKMRGQGNEPAEKGVPGDLLIKVLHDFPEDITARGLDIVHTYKVDVLDAIAGCTIYVRVSEDTIKEIHLKELTPQGKVYRISGYGAHAPVWDDNKDHSRGDYYVMIEYTYPKKLDGSIKDAIMNSKATQKDKVIDIKVEKS